MLIYNDRSIVKYSYSIKSKPILKILISRMRDRELHGIRSKYSLSLYDGISSPFVSPSRHLLINFGSHVATIANETRINYLIATLSNLSFISNHHPFYSAIYPHKKSKPLVYTKKYLSSLPFTRRTGYDDIYRQSIMIKLGFLGTVIHKIFPFQRRIQYK